MTPRAARRRERLQSRLLAVLPHARRLGVFVVVTLLGGATAFAQAADRGPPVGPGERVRVTTAAGTIEGILTSVRDDILMIRPRDGITDAPVVRAAIRKLERTMGYRSRARYAGFGTLIGLGGGAAVGLASGCSPHSFLCSAELNAIAGGILGAAAGAVVGAIIPPAPQWVEVDLSTLTEIPQPVRPPTPTKIQPWDVAFGTGVAQGGPRRELGGAMHRAGFGDTSPAFFGPASPHPRSGNDPGSFWFEADRRVRQRWNVGVRYYRTRIGHTYGFHSPFQFLFVNYETTSVAAVASRTFGPARLGIGPAWYSARSSEDHSAERVSHSRVGVVAAGGLSLPVHTRVYFDLSLQYHHVGRANIGPFKPSDVIGVPISFPAADVPFNHWFISFGPGVRF